MLKKLRYTVQYILFMYRRTENKWHLGVSFLIILRRVNFTTNFPHEIKNL
jgi:hypothetical protein